MKISTSIALLFAIVSASAMGADATAPSVSVVTVTGDKKPPANYSFIIDCTPPLQEKVGDNLHFQITVVSRTGTFSSNTEGLLEIFDPQGHILSCDLHAQPGGKKMIYEFDLSPRYLAKSRFAFKTSGVETNGTQSADVLWVSLIDFVKPSLRQ